MEANFKTHVLEMERRHRNLKTTARGLPLENRILTDTSRSKVGTVLMAGTTALRLENTLLKKNSSLLCTSRERTNLTSLENKLLSTTVPDALQTKGRLGCSDSSTLLRSTKLVTGRPVTSSGDLKSTLLSRQSLDLRTRKRDVGLRKVQNNQLEGSRTASATSCTQLSVLRNTRLFSKFRRTEKDAVQESPVREEKANEYTISKPHYEISIEEDYLDEKEDENPYPFEERRGKIQQTISSDVMQNKLALLHEVAVSLLHSPDFKSSTDETRTYLESHIANLMWSDPEFILKVALYTRRELNIRTTSNFIIAAASRYTECRPYLCRYFSASILLPTDWIEVAEIYQSLHDECINYGSLPSALRRVMVAKFPDFDEYQLAKYNKDKSKTMKKKTPQQKPMIKQKQSCPEDQLEDIEEDRLSCSGADESETEEVRERKTFTLKQLIRKLHISEPVPLVMGILGKKYPEDEEAFRSSRLPGMWEPERAGKRMKLATPETWETQVSSKGNKAKTWEDLLDHRKLPYMAMLRNIRNMLKAGIDEKHHKMVIKKLSDEESVIRSKQFPLRFLSAFEVLNQLEEEYNKVIGLSLEEIMARKNARKNITRSRSGNQRQSRKRSAKDSDRMLASDIMYDVEQIDAYRKALESALKTATIHNLQPIPGTTYILCNADTYMSATNCQSAKGLGKPRTLLEMALLLGLMCKSCCEQSEFLLFSGEKYFIPKLAGKDSLLSNVELVKNQAQNFNAGEGGQSLKIFFAKAAAMKVPVNNVLIIGSSQSPNANSGLVTNFVSELRQLVNERLLYVMVDLSGRTNVDRLSAFANPLDVTIAGYSDQILRFVAERGSTDQLAYVDNIDSAYNLQNIKVQLQSSAVRSTFHPSLSSIGRQVTSWKAVRVFISSTFKDMHGERDLLTRFVFPELRARASKHFISVYEVDLRWGITEHEARSERQLEICLAEVAQADMFVGLLGDRYGWVPDEYIVQKTSEFDWLQKMPHGKSITEIEMTHFAFHKAESTRGKAFFYIRDQSFLSDLPEKYALDFKTDSPEGEMQLKNLKQKILTSGLETFNNYPCRWEGVVDGKPMVTGLEEFGTRVLNNLWNAIKTCYIETECDDLYDTMDEFMPKNVHTAYAEKLADTFVTRKTSLRQFYDQVNDNKKSGIILLTGKAGCGKSCLMAEMAKKYRDQNDFVCCFFADAVTGNKTVTALLEHFTRSFAMTFELDFEESENYSELRNKFHESLKILSKRQVTKGPLVLFIDGIEKLEQVAGSSLLDWIPSDIPKGILFVVPCLENGMHQKILMSNYKDVELVKVGPMSIFERGEMVRKVLRQYRKALDESAFNNQMKILLSKRDACLPLFLSLACEEIRLFGVYEKVTDHLRNLPQTVNLMLQSITQRLEDDFGKDLVSIVMACIYISRQGLAKEELFEITNVLVKKQDFSFKELTLSLIAQTLEAPEPDIPVAVFIRLCRCLQGYLSEADDRRLLFSTGLLKDLVWQKYVRPHKGDYITKIHLVFAGYYKKRADLLGNGNFAGNDTQALSELAYHLLCAGAWSDLKNVLCSLKFISRKIELGIGSQLPEDFAMETASLTMNQQKNKQKLVEDKRFVDYKEFVCRNLHVLDRFPGLVYQQAYNEPDSSSVFRDVVASGNNSNIIRWINKPLLSSTSARTLTGFSQYLLCVALSPDNQSVACGAMNGEVRLFDVITGKELKTFFGHSSAISSVCFVGPNKLCTASWDSTLSVWDIHGGHRVHVLNKHRRRVVACTTVPASKKVISVSWDSTARLWNCEDGKEIANFKGMSNKPINCVACDNSGRLVALGGWNYLVVLWDIVNNKRYKVLKGHQASVRAVRFSDDSKQVVSASIDGQIALWSVEGGIKVGQFSSKTKMLTQLRFSPTASEMFTVGHDGVIKVWSANLGQPVSSLNDSNDSAVAVAVNSLTSEITIGYHSGDLKTYDMRSGDCVWATKAHASRIHGVCWSKDASLLISGSEDKCAKVFKERKALVTLEAHEGAVRCVRISNAYICTASDDHTLMLWSCLFMDANHSPNPEVTLTGHTGPVTCCDFSPCGTKLASGSYDKMLIIWDVLSFVPLFTLYEAHHDWIMCCSWSDIGDYVVTGSNDFNLKVWDTKTGVDKVTIKGNQSAVNCVDYKFGCISSVAFDGTARVWTQRGAEITTIKAHRERVNACMIWAPRLHHEAMADLEWSEDDTEGLSRTKLESIRQPKLEDVILLTASDDGSVKLWNPFTPHLLKTFHGHSDIITGLDVTKNGKQVVTACYDRTLRFWNNSLLDAVQCPHEGEVTSMAVNTSKCIVLSAGRDGKIIKWNLSKNEETVKLNVTKDKIIQASSGCVTCVAFVNNSNDFVSGDSLGNLILWSADGTPPVTLLSDEHPITKVGVLENHIVVLRREDCVVVERKNSSSTYVVRQADKTYLFRDLTVLPNNKSALVVGSDGCMFSLVENKGSNRRPNKGRFYLKSTQADEAQDSECPISRSPTLSSDSYCQSYWYFSCAATNDVEHGTIVVVGDNDGSVHVLQGKEVFSDDLTMNFKIHNGAVTCVSVCKSHIVTGSRDRIVKVWNRTNINEQIGLYIGQSVITSLTSYEDENSKTFIVYGDADGNVEFLEFSSPA